jgi:hypothetical protein
MRAVILIVAARKSSLNIKAMRDAGKHIRRTGFAGLIDDINR